VLVPASTHTSRLVASRFQLDMLLSPLMLIARTDAESARLLSSTVDASDHAHVLGTTTSTGFAEEGERGGGLSLPLAETIALAEARGASGKEVDAIEAEWTATHKLCTFDDGPSTSRRRACRPH
jgi:isocitrate lyase